MAMNVAPSLLPPVAAVKDYPAGRINYDTLKWEAGPHAVYIEGSGSFVFQPNAALSENAGIIIDPRKASSGRIQWSSAPPFRIAP